MTDSASKQIRKPTERSLQAIEEDNNIQKRKMSLVGQDGSTSKKSKTVTINSKGLLLALDVAHHAASGVAQGNTGWSHSSASLRQSEASLINVPESGSTDPADQSTITIDSSGEDHVPMYISTTGMAHCQKETSP